MKKIILIASVGLLGAFIFFCRMQKLEENKSFFAQENNLILIHEGVDFKVRYSPCSTFKIPLALMGYDAGILDDENSPEFPCKDEYEIFLDVWRGPHKPQSWIRNSCVWYSRIITTALGLNKFKNYIEKLNYGNQDVSGNASLNDGLTHSWLSSSLTISAEEQIIFLQKLIKNELPVSLKAHEMTKKIMFIQELPAGWKLYGKTGNGRLLDKNGNQSALQQGWFVGWIEKCNRTIVFVSHILDKQKHDVFASFRARSQALLKLHFIIDELEK